jgi:hypothetical protein
MKTAQDLIEEILDSAAAHAREGRRVTGYNLNADDYDMVRDHLHLAGSANAKTFNMHTARGVIEVAPATLLDRGMIVAVCRPNATDYARLDASLKPTSTTHKANCDGVACPGYPHCVARADGITSPIAQQLLDERNRFTITGKFRVYFNRHGAEPLMWCVSPETGGWEIAVRDVQLAAIAETVYRKKETADEDDGRPSAWFAIEGVLTVNAAGFATIGAP